jgi:hypothetical protein
MWTSRVAESVRDGAADAVVVALHMSIPQGRRSKKAVSVGINDERTTPTHARLNKLADVSPQCQNRDSEMQRYCCILLCLRKEDDGDGQAAEEGPQKKVVRALVEGHPPEISDREVDGPLREVPIPELVSLRKLNSSFGCS